MSPASGRRDPWVLAGAYMMQVYHLPAATACEGVSVACNVPLTATIEHPLDKDLYAFAVADGDTMEINVIRGAPSDLSFTPLWRLLTASDTPAADCGLYRGSPREDCGPLPASGNPYRVEVVDQLADATGTYRVLLVSLGAARPSRRSPSAAWCATSTTPALPA